MIYILGTLGLTSLVLGAMGYLMDRPRKRERRALPVSYTHLDVYKRQAEGYPPGPLGWRLQ